MEPLMTGKILACLFMLAFLVGCAAEADATPVAFGQAPAHATNTTSEKAKEEAGSEPTNTPPPTEAAATEAAATVRPATATPVSEENERRRLASFSDLRFATSSDGAPQSSFPNGTEVIYAIWNYDGMQNGDNMTRVWYLNDELFIERVEAWDFAKYGASGTVRDIFMYDYIDGIDVGQWRVELYINGEPPLVGTFTVE